MSSSFAQKAFPPGWKGFLFVAVIGLVCIGYGVAGCDPTSPVTEPGQEVTVADAGTDGGSPDTLRRPDTTTTKETAPDAPKTEQTIQRKWTYRIIAGVSMGGGMSSIIGARHPDKFDIIGTLGAPNDFRYLFHYINKGMLSGFCDLKKLEEAAKNGKLNTPEAYCAPTKPSPMYPFEVSSHFNNWYYDDAGGNWNRPKLVQVLHDLSLALGNPGYYNEKNSYWPHPSIPVDRRTAKDRCANPIRIKGVKHDLYNPDGKYDLITFCDGNTERDGMFRPDRPAEHTTPMEVALAVDINGNGKRDYGEPVVITPYERFEDVGKDGCGNDREDGKGGCVPEGQKGPGGDDPNGDDFDPVNNPSGTQGNLLFDKGEPYKDDGLDGVPNTKDYGEGDGTFTMTPGYANFLAHSPRDLIENMSRDKVNRLNVYIDAGIRDLFNFQITSLMLMGALKTHYPNDAKRVQLFDQFMSLMPKGETSFDHTQIDWSTKGQHVYVRYGDPNADASKIAQGDGDHVHGGRIIDRIFSFLSFVKHHLPKPDLEPTTLDRKTDEGKTLHFSYDSKALGTKNVYSVVLPPGYYANPDKKYPVLYFGHGYGMDGPGMANILVLLAPAMQSGTIPKMISVAVHGSCEQLVPVPGEKGKFTKKAWGGCHRGTFYVDAKGVNNDGLKMEQAFFEVVNEVETRYGNRIRKEETLPYRIPR